MMVDQRLKRAIRTLGHRCRHFLGDRRGNVAVMAAFSVVPLMATVGVATDSARSYLLNNRLQEAIDIAALAAARDDNEATRQSTLEQYFWANFPAGYLGAEIGENDPELVPIAGTDQFRVSISASMPNTFLQLIDINTTTISATTVVQKEGRGMELVLVMDNTGSMRHDGKMDAMTSAALGLISTLYGAETTIENFWVGVVPYQATVNIGYTHADWLEFGGVAHRNSYFFDPYGEDYVPHYGYYSSDRSYFRPGGVSNPNATIYMSDYFRNDMYRMHNSGDPYYDSMPEGWKGCVEARHQNGLDQTDELPIYPNQFVPYYNPSASDNPWCRYDDDSYFANGDYCTNPMDSPGSSPRELLVRIDERNSAHLTLNATGPNRGCPQPILPLVADRTAVEGSINQMQAWRYGGTFGNLGLVWGWRVISPRWRGYWDGSPGDLPLDYDTPLMDKVVIMLTDGENRFSSTNYSAYGRPAENRFGVYDQEAELDTRMATTCEAMKAEGIILYTITFALNDNDTKTLYENCATSTDHYFDSPTNETLAQVFDIIAGQLTNLRLAQ